MNRATVGLTIKDTSEERRELTGVATTSSLDRVGDVLDPMGASWRGASIPLLWAHQHDKPVGRATLGKATKAGIPFVAKIPKVTEPGIIRDITDAAWHAAKYRLINSVSIGFAPEPKAMERIDTGILFSRFEILELSLVSVPANFDAQIETVRGGASLPVVRIGKPTRVVRIDPSDIEYERWRKAAVELNAIRRMRGQPVFEPTRARFDEFQKDFARVKRRQAQADQRLTDIRARAARYRAGLGVKIR